MYAVLVSALVAIGVLAAGAAATRVGPWFEGLRKPRWNPPGWLFGPMWTTIAALAVWSAAAAWLHAPEAHARIITLFGINAALNVAWSPLFFVLRRPDWALVEVSLFWLSIVALIAGLASLSPVSAWLIVPYLVWVTIASGLNFEIVRLNAPFGQVEAI